MNFKRIHILIFSLFIIAILFAGCATTAMPATSDASTLSTTSRDPTLETLTNAAGSGQKDQSEILSEEAPSADVANSPEDESDTAPKTQSGAALRTPSQTAGSTLTVYFIDVGQADSALIVSGDETMLIDGGNVGDSDLIYTFLKNHGVEHLSYVIGTHAHEDHIGGLAGALNYATVDKVYCPVTDYDSKAFGDFVKYVNKQDVQIEVPVAGTSFSLGSATVQIIAPVAEYDSPNNTSIVLKITNGSTSFLFTGDAEREAEADILASGYDLYSTVLKVGHHGSETSTTYPYLREIMPQYAVISCGKGNSYGHPHEDTLSKLRDADVTVFRTDMQGTITCVSDGNSVTFTTERNSDAITNPTASAEQDKRTPPLPTEDNTPVYESPVQTPQDDPAPASTAENYIGNLNTHKFHLPTCGSLPAPKNQTFFDTREKAISSGYVPCKNCNP